MGADLAAGFGAMAAIVDADRQNLVRIGDGRPQRDRVERDRPRRLAGLHRDPVDSGLERGPEIGPMRVERRDAVALRSEEHTSELQSLMRISYAVFCLKKKNKKTNTR